MSLQHSLLFFHEDAQVNGINFLMDFGDVKMNMITWVGLENWTKSADYGTVSFMILTLLSPVLYGLWFNRS